MKFANEHQASSLLLHTSSDHLRVGFWPTLPERDPENTSPFATRRLTRTGNPASNTQQNLPRASNVISSPLAGGIEELL